MKVAGNAKRVRALNPWVGLLGPRSLGLLLSDLLFRRLGDAAGIVLVFLGVRLALFAVGLVRQRRYVFRQDVEINS